MLFRSEHVKSIQDERIEYEQRQVKIVNVLKFLFIILIICTIPIFYQTWQKGGSDGGCVSERDSFHSSGSINDPLSGLNNWGLWRTIKRWFGYNEPCSKDVKVSVTNADGHRIQTTTKTLTCEKSTEDRKSTRLNSSHIPLSRMPSSA